MDKINIYKIGGKVIGDAKRLSTFLQKFADLDGNKILVHGGGNKLEELGDRLGVKTKMDQGRRITDNATIDLAAMTYGGYLNKNIVVELQHINCDAIGLSGVDGKAIEAVKRPVEAIDFGWVGDITSVNVKLIATLLNLGLTPVFCALSGAEGRLLNINADTIATAIAIAMSGTYQTMVHYLFEKEGVLSDPLDEQSVISSITKAEYQQMKVSGAISEGMIPKLDNAFIAIDYGVSEVVIGSHENVFDANGKKTIIQ